MTLGRGMSYGVVDGKAPAVGLAPGLRVLVQGLLPDGAVVEEIVLHNVNGVMHARATGRRETLPVCWYTRLPLGGSAEEMARRMADSYIDRLSVGQEPQDAT